jgi:hypothetical protein
MFMSMSMHEVWLGSNAQDKIISIWIIFQTRLFQDIFRPSPSQFRHTFCSSPSIAKRRQWTRFCCWFRRPSLILSRGCCGTARGRPAPTSPLWNRKKVLHIDIQQIVRLADRLGAFATIKSPGLRLWCGLVFHPITETYPGMTIQTFSAWKSAAAESLCCELHWRFYCQTF